MPSQEQISRFLAVKEPENDQFLSKVVQLHGPFDSQAQIASDCIPPVLCYACYTHWPCSTFITLEHRRQEFSQRMKRARAGVKPKQSK